ncbi:hypothetical protein P8452_20529 [Trifolium repens]|nr:hypothetical protein P8452_20529 [Trifolium repens]
MAIPNRDMVKEHNAEMERDKNTSSLKRTCFEARKNIIAPSGSRDAIVETLIYNTSMNFPFRSITYPRISTFLPCFATPMCYLTHMDNLMASTKRWTDNCMGWVPPIFSNLCRYLVLHPDLSRYGMRWFVVARF